MIVEFGVIQCDVARRPAIIVYHLVWDGNHSDNATIIDEWGPTLIHWGIFNTGIVHVYRLVGRK
jgi:hypothetical protein